MTNIRDQIKPLHWINLAEMDPEFGTEDIWVAYGVNDEYCLEANAEGKYEVFADDEEEGDGTFDDLEAAKQACEEDYRHAVMRFFN